MKLSFFELAMTFEGTLKDQKPCSVCESPSARIFLKEAGYETLFAMLTYGPNFEPKGEADLRTQVWGIQMYACTNSKCRHIDLYHTGEFETKDNSVLTR